MQCRNSLRQQVTAQVPRTKSSNIRQRQYVWISDDQLSEAFTRFVRVSHTCRRYGSSVPGPLESHRRLSKRRIGLASVAASSPPPLADFGALFGAASLPGGALQWEPPSLGNQLLDREPTTRPSRGLWPWVWEETASKTLEDQRSISSSCEPPITRDESLDPVKASRDAFLALLSSKEERQCLDETDVRAVLEFLQSSLDEPKASNLSTLLHWLQQHPITAPALSAVTALIVDKARLGTISPSNFSAAVTLLPKVHGWHKTPEIQQTILASLSILSDVLVSRPGVLMAKENRYRTIHSLFAAARSGAGHPEGCSFTLQKLALISSKRNSIHTKHTWVAQTLASVLASLPLQRDIAPEARSKLSLQLLDVLRSSKEPNLIQNVTRFYLCHKTRKPRDIRTLAKITYWLRCLHDGNHFEDLLSGRRISPSWAVYQVLAEYYDASDLARHFANTKRAHFSQALLVGWLGRWKAIGADAAYTTPTDHDGVQQGTLHNQYLLSNRLSRELEELNRSEKRDPLVNLLLILQRHAVPYQSAILQIFETLEAGNCDRSRLSSLFTQIQEIRSLQIPAKNTLSQINALLERNQHLAALRVFLDTPDFPISACPNLASRLLSSTPKDNAIVRLALSHRHHTEGLPDHGSRQHIKQNTLQNRAELVQQLALIVADSPSWNSRMAYRRVWQCYRFCCDRRLELRPVLSRAMVRAGIIRTLQERLPLPDERVKFILSLVRRLEGDHVADEVDQLVHALRHRLQRKIQTKKASKKRLFDVQVSQQVTSWRIKPWTKLRPVRVQQKGDCTTYVIHVHETEGRRSELVAS